MQVWTARPDGQLDFVSRRTSAYFDAPAEQVLGTGWATYVHPDDLPTALAKWSTALATSIPSEAQLALEGEHPAFGPVSLRQLLATWVAHDLGHVAQCTRVMAKQYRGAVGPWRAYLPVMDR